MKRVGKRVINICAWYTKDEYTQTEKDSDKITGEPATGAFRLSSESRKGKQAQGVHTIGIR